MCGNFRFRDRFEVQYLLLLARFGIVGAASPIIGLDEFFFAFQALYITEY